MITAILQYEEYYDVEAESPEDAMNAFSQGEHDEPFETGSPYMYRYSAEKVEG